MIDVPMPPRLSPPAELLGTATFRGVLVHALLDWACIFACWELMALSPGWTWPLFIVLVGGRLHALAVLAHDAIHSPWQEDRHARRVLGPLCGFPVATTLDAMRYHHLRHHRESGLPADPYFTPSLANAPWRRALSMIYVSALPFLWSLRPWFGLVALAIPSLRTTYARVFLQDVSKRKLRDDPEVLQCLRAEPWQAAFQLAVIACAIAAPRAVVFGWLLPMLVAGVVNARRLMLEHTYTPGRDRTLASILSTTRDHGVGVASQVVLAPHCIGLHVVHHLHPQVAFQRLPALRTWYRERLGTAYPPLQSHRLF